MWAVVRYTEGGRDTDMRGEESRRWGPKVQVQVYESLEKAQLSAFNHISSGVWHLHRNLFIVEVSK